MKRMLLLFIAAFTLVGCAAEQNYRGVPSPSWKHLSAEQKQLIVDRAYQDEIKQEGVVRTEK